MSRNASVCNPDHRRALAHHGIDALVCFDRKIRTCALVSITRPSRATGGLLMGTGS